MRPGERVARAAAYERARPEILAHVPPDARRVLDLGCATGATGAALKARGAVEVVGVELEPEYAREAARTLDRVIVADAEAPPQDVGRFDVLIAADILEHLKDPWAALRAYADHLEPGATAIVSLPNVAHWSTYAALARGHWPRRPEGIFDATHLRWFTLDDARDLLVQAGLTPHTVIRRPWLWTRGSRLDALAPPLLNVPGLRTLITFQHVIVATL
jgi:SAM-dependent methyltransferase